MKVYVTTGFRGHYPVGTAAVVVAENEEQALLMLNVELRDYGLGPTTLEDAAFHKVDTRTAKALVLNDGNY